MTISFIRDLIPPELFDEQNYKPHTLGLQPRFAKNVSLSLYYDKDHSTSFCSRDGMERTWAASKGSLLKPFEEAKNLGDLKIFNPPKTLKNECHHKPLPFSNSLHCLISQSQLVIACKSWISCKLCTQILWLIYLSERGMIWHLILW